MKGHNPPTTEATMTITTTSLENQALETIRDIAETTARQHNWQSRVTLSYGRLFVELAAAHPGGCCSHQSVPTPPWAWIERGDVIGTFQSQCGGCGQQGSAWHLWRATLDLDIDNLDELDACIDGAKATIGEMATDMAAALGQAITPGD